MNIRRQIELLVMRRSTPEEISRKADRALQDAMLNENCTRKQVAEVDDAAVYKLYRDDDGGVVFARKTIVKRTAKQIRIADHFDQERTLPRGPIEAGQHVEVGSRRHPQTFVLGSTARSILERQLAQQERRVAGCQRRVDEIHRQIGRGQFPFSTEERAEIESMVIALSGHARPSKGFDWRKEGF